MKADGDLRHMIVRGVWMGVGVAGFGSWLADMLSHPVAAPRWDEVWRSIFDGVVFFAFGYFLLGLPVIWAARRRASQTATEILWGIAFFMAVLAVARFATRRWAEAMLLNGFASWMWPLGLALVVAILASLLERVPRFEGRIASGLAVLVSFLIPSLAVYLCLCLEWEVMRHQRAAIYGMIVCCMLVIVGGHAILRSPQREKLWAALTAILALCGATAVVVRVITFASDQAAWAGMPDDADPQMLLLTADTLRGDAPHFMNPAMHETPGMDGLAADGFVFEKACSAAPWTLPSFAAIMTGQTSGVSRVITMQRKLSDKFDTLAEHLRERGYRTEAAVQNLFLRPDHQFDQGFERYNFIEDVPPDYGWNPVARLALRWPGNYVRADMNARLVMDAQRFFERRAGRPFFLWLHFLDPHVPLTPSNESLRKVTSDKLVMRTFTTKEQTQFSPDERKAIRALYDAEVLDLDRAIGNLLGTMRRKDFYDETAIAFTSDHGEAFWEHRQFGHGSSLHKEQIHVPLVIKLSSSNSPRGRTTMPVSNARLFATFLELAGLPIAQATVMENASLLPVLHDKSAAPLPVYANGVVGLIPPQHSIIADGFKLMRSDEPAAFERLYEVDSDFEERNDLSKTAPEKLNASQAALDDHMQSENAYAQLHEIAEEEITLDLGEGEYEKLEALGYFQ